MKAYAIVTDLDTGIPCVVNDASDNDLQQLADSESYCVVKIKPDGITVISSDGEVGIPEGRIQSDGSLVVTDLEG